MPKFIVAVQKPQETELMGGASFNLKADDYSFEEEFLTPIGAEIVEIPATTDADFIKLAKDADAVIARGRNITAEIIGGLSNCKIIGCGSVGTDRVDVEAATVHGIPVTNVPDVFIEEVADHTMTLLLAIHRHLYEMRDLMRAGRWTDSHPYLRSFPRLFGQTLGLIAFGNVAKAVARRAKPFGFHILAYDPYVSEIEMTSMGVEPVSFTELLERADFVSNHGPLNDETRKIMSTEQFAMMKNSAMFINAGRGPSQDEAALINALEKGDIAGAALDVFETEPIDVENPLLRMDTVIVTPHVASATARFLPETRKRLGQEIALVLQGKWPRSAVNPQVLQNSQLERWQPQPMQRGPNH